MLRFPSSRDSQFISGQPVKIIINKFASEIRIRDLDLLPDNASSMQSFLLGRVIGLSEDEEEVLVKIETNACDSQSIHGLQYDKRFRKYVWLEMIVLSNGQAIINGCMSGGVTKGVPLLIK